jgi:hypothetical protein
VDFQRVALLGELPRVACERTVLVHGLERIGGSACLQRATRAIEQRAFGLELTIRRGR